ncbi:MAG: hypothetical protein BRD55_11430 [Bacteroidetes bacterium SW_9_63_38]|nr:MAG: hypothetical protein BRD55_11430 [Bacteroidetes bacterium SW_9_63_38]
MIALAVLLVSMSVAAPATHAQSSYDLYGSARADALGNATTALPDDVGVHANPAARATLSQSTALFYARQSFGLSALQYGASHVAVPFEWGTLSSGLSTFGFEEYREIHASAGYAYAVSFGTARRVRVGTTLRYHHTSIEGYGSAGTVGVNLGIGVSLLRSLHLGVHATNVNGATLVSGEPIPRTLAVGLFYKALDSVQVVTDLFKDVRFPASVRGGLTVTPVDPLVLRAGVTSTPVRFAGGMGVRLGPLNAHVAAEQHQTLGWSPSVSLRVRW